MSPKQREEVRIPNSLAESDPGPEQYHGEGNLESLGGGTQSLDPAVG